MPAPPRTVLSMAALLAFATLLVGVVARTALDALLSHRGGAAAIAAWAQVASVVDLVAAIACAGLGPGVTVLVARAADPGEQRRILRDAVTLALGLSAATAAVVAAVLALGPGIDALRSPTLRAAALGTGLVAVVPALVTQSWQARGRPARTLAFTIAAAAMSLVAAATAPPHALPAVLLAVSAATATGLALAVFRPRMPAFVGPARTAAARPADAARPGSAPSSAMPSASGGASSGAPRERFRVLLAWLPAGLSIGLLSPLSMLGARELLGNGLGWDAAGTVQAIWRSADWVGAFVSGMLSLHVLPRLSRAAAGPLPALALRREAAHAARWLLLPAGVALALVALAGPSPLARLFGLPAVPPAVVLATFLLGEWIRMGSWVLLQVLFATGAQRAIAAGELLSLPLFAALLWLQGPTVTLAGASRAYLAAYVAYLAFNLAVAWPRLRGRAPRPPAYNPPHEA